MVDGDIDPGAAVVVQWRGKGRGGVACALARAVPGLCELAAGAVGWTGFQAAREYWLEQFSGEVPVLELLGDRVRPAVKTYRGGMIERRLRPGTCRQLRALLHDQATTLFMGLLAAVNVLLYRYTGQKDIVVGSPIAGREHPDLEGQLGCYLNTLALRCGLGGEESYRELLGRMREVTLGAYAHQSYPFDELVDELRLRRDMSRSPLFDVLINVPPVGIIGSTPEFSDIRVSAFVDREREISKFDLSFIFVELGEELRIGIEYNSDMYDRDTVERMGGSSGGSAGSDRGVSGQADRGTGVPECGRAASTADNVQCQVCL
jgi:hypothetical protein